MMRLSELSGQELAEIARKRAEEARESDAQLGEMLAGLFSTVEEMTRRLNEDE